MYGDGNIAKMAIDQVDLIQSKDRLIEKLNKQ